MTGGYGIEYHVHFTPEREFSSRHSLPFADFISNRNNIVLLGCVRFNNVVWYLFTRTCIEENIGFKCIQSCIRYKDKGTYHFEPRPLSLFFNNHKIYSVCTKINGKKLFFNSMINLNVEKCLTSYFRFAYINKTDILQLKKVLNINSCTKNLTEEAENFCFYLY